MDNEKVIKNLNTIVRDLNHWEFDERRDRAHVEGMKSGILEAIKLIYEQENIIKALMGDFGDSCGIDGCGKDDNNVDGT